MASITVRALILVLVFGICNAGEFKMSDSKCKMEGGEEIIKELKKNHADCVELAKPGADLKMVREDPNYLTDDEMDAIGVCMCKKKGTISPEGVFLLDKAAASVDEMTGTEEAVKLELKNGMFECGKEKDAKEECVAIMNCVYDHIKKVCGFPKKPEKQE